MRRVDDEKLIQMLQDGVQQKTIAGQFGVTPQYINRRIKQLKSYQQPESFSKLTEKKKRFVLEKVAGKSNMVAVKSAYDVTSNESAKALGTTLMKDPDISVAIQDLMSQEGITRRRRIQRLRDMVECPDLSVAGKGLDMSFKLTGEYAPEKDRDTEFVHSIVKLIQIIKQQDAENEEPDFINVKPIN